MCGKDRRINIHSEHFIMWLRIIRCINCVTNECIVNYLLALCPGTLPRVLLTLVGRYVGSKNWKYQATFKERANLWNSCNPRWNQHFLLNSYAKAINANCSLIFKCDRSRRCVDVLLPKRCVTAHMSVLRFTTNPSFTVLFVLKKRP